MSEAYVVFSRLFLPIKQLSNIRMKFGIRRLILWAKDVFYDLGLISKELNYELYQIFVLALLALTSIFGWLRTWRIPLLARLLKMWLLIMENRGLDEWR